MTPTAEQAAIIHAAKSTNDSLLINALAGAAKTTTLVMLAHELPLQAMLCIAFNKRIADEMQKRMPGHVQCKTVNAVGHQVWGRVTGNRLTVDTKKNYTLLKEEFDKLPKEQRDRLGDSFSSILKSIGLAKSSGYVPKAFQTIGTSLLDREELLDVLAPAVDVDLEDEHLDLLDTILGLSITKAYKGYIDFDDQIYMSTLFGGSFPKFPLVMVDEAQDLSALNHEMVKKLVGDRLIAVGDPWQCHPPGTLITMTGGHRIPIEHLMERSEVVSYFTQETIFRGLKTQGRRVEMATTTDFSGDLVVVHCGPNTVKMTPSHRCLVRMAEKQGYALYMMRRGNQYRIGVARVQYEAGSGVAMRARQEGADAAWILAVYAEKEIACVFENAYGVLFGLPQLLFNHPNNSANLQANINTAWQLIGNNTAGAMEALKYFKRDHQFPVWTADESNQHFGRKSFVTQACNLIDGMLMCIMNKEPHQAGADRSASWENIAIEYESYIGPVYGLQVEPTEGGRRLYVANNIVVHNSIYAFRGAHTESMSWLKDEFNMKEFTLSVSFRCPIKIVELARWRVPHFKYRDGAEEGEVTNFGKWDQSHINESAAILCRNNAPLFKCALKLIQRGRGVKLVGSELGPNLIKTLRKLGDPHMNKEKTLEAITKWEDEGIAKAREARKASIRDRAECLRVFADFGATLNEAIAYAEHLFSATGTISLMTGHKAKGLEFDFVFWLDPWRIPSRYAREAAEAGDDRQLQQELNLKYVIQTRAKKAHFTMNLEDMQ